MRVDLAGATVVAAESSHLLADAALHLLADHDLLHDESGAPIASVARAILAPWEPFTTRSWHDVRAAEDRALAATLTVWRSEWAA